MSFGVHHLMVVWLEGVGAILKDGLRRRLLIDGGAREGVGVMVASKITVAEVTDWLRSVAPEEHALSWDRVGLQTGDPARPVRRVLVALELTDPVVEEAERGRADLLVLHHPIIFEPLSTLREDSAPGKRITRLVRKRVSAYVMHTNYDACAHSMSAEMLRRIGVADPVRVVPKPGAGRVKIAVFCPKDHTDRIRAAMAAAGAGVIGEYELCSFLTPGTGTFRGSEAASPFIGEAGKFERAEEDRLEMICPRARVAAVAAAMVRAHPYEEPAYDIYPLQDLLGDEHFLWVGELPKAMRLDDVAKTASKKIAEGRSVMVVGRPGRRVRRVAAASGGGRSLLKEVAALGVDCYLTGEIDHHAAREAENPGFGVVAVGHYESEVLFGPIVASLLRAEFPGAEVRVSRALRPALRVVGPA